MKIAIGADKSGFRIKQKLIFELSEKYDFIDVGSFDEEVCDYPAFAIEVCDKILSGDAQFGVLLCASGEGMCIAANKINGIRCGIAYNNETAKLLRNHNDANVIAFGTKFMEYTDIKERVGIFCNSIFLGLHHIKRIEMINDLEKRRF